MTSSRDDKYRDNGETEGLTLRQLVLEVRQDVKDLKEADTDHDKAGHGKHPTWAQIIAVVGTLVGVMIAFTQLVG